MQGESPPASSSARAAGPGRRQKGNSAVKEVITQEVLEYSKNAKGGIKVTDEHMKYAWKFLSDCQDPMTDFANPEHMDKLSVRELHKVMRSIYPKLTLKESTWIANNLESMTEQQLHNLVKDNAEADFDPVLEAFKTLSTDGALDMEKIGEIYKWLGFFGQGQEHLSQDNAKILRQVVTRLVERSGGEKGKHRLDINAFRMICPFGQPEIVEDEEAQDDDVFDTIAPVATLPDFGAWGEMALGGIRSSVAGIGELAELAGGGEEDDDTEKKTSPRK